MKCPRCKQNLERIDRWIDVISETRTKPPKVYWIKYRLKECLRCKIWFYVKGKKIEALKGD